MVAFFKVKEMKTFDISLEGKLKELPYVPHLDDGGYNDGVIDGFESGAEWAAQTPELINEILTKYMEWAHNLPAQQFANWDDEEGDKEKTKARIRKEFIDFLKREGWSN